MRKLTIEHCHKIASKKNGKFLDLEYNGVHYKHLWQCERGHQWKAIFNNIKKGRWCPHCIRSSYSTEYCKKFAAQKGGKFLSSHYINFHTKYLWECKNRHQWEAKFSNVKYGGNWCPECVGLKKLTIHHCHIEATKKHGKCLSTEYTNNKTKMFWQCSKGHIWKATLDDIKNSNNWCRKCAGLEKLTIEHCQEIAAKNNGKCLSTEYINNHSKYTWKCKFKHVWEAKLSSVKSGCWCPYCAGVAKLTLNDCHATATERKGKCLSDAYINSKTKMKWKCLEGHTWQATFNNISRGKWCPKCKTKTQTYIYDICKEMFPDYEIKYNFRGFDWLKSNKNGKFELDIYIPKLKLAIEYDGEQHFKPVQFGNMPIKEAKERLIKQQNRDKIKLNKIKSNSKDVKYFIRFSYDENLTKKYIKNKINSHL